MRAAVLERTFRVVLRSDAISEEIEFLWHAGEPLIVGTAYYEHAMRAQQENNQNNVLIKNAVQTNATLINDNWASFLRRHDFRVGVSIDGPAFLHDMQRPRRSGRTSHEKVMRGVMSLRRQGIDPGVICVLTRTALRYPDEIFDFFWSNDFRSVAFNVEESENANSSSSVGGARWQDSRVIAEYENFMRRFLDIWWPHRREMRIREFDRLARLFQGFKGDPNIVPDVLETQPLGIVTILRNGDIVPYSPEFAGATAYEYNNFVVSNVSSIETLDDISESKAFRKLANEVVASVSQCHRDCRLFNICGGGFLSNKFSENRTLRSTITSTCVLRIQVLSKVLATKIREERELRLAKLFSGQSV